MNDLPCPCERWTEPISLAAAGCLSPDEEREVRRHIETCSDCRERLRKLKQLCGVLAKAQFPAVGAEAAVVERISSAIASDASRRLVAGTRARSVRLAPVARPLDIWRWIMRSPVSRATAAMIFVLAIIGAALWFHGGGATPALAVFVEPILDAKTVKYNRTRKTAEDREARTQKSIEAQKRIRRGLDFVLGLPQDADAHYVGKGVSLGEADTPIFWYRPANGKKYRVICADLSVRDADTPPGVPKSHPAPAASRAKQ